MSGRKSIWMVLVACALVLCGFSGMKSFAQDDADVPPVVTDPVTVDEGGGSSGNGSSGGGATGYRYSNSYTYVPSLTYGSSGSAAYSGGSSGTSIAAYSGGSSGGGSQSVPSYSGGSSGDAILVTSVTVEEPEKPLGFFGKVAQRIRNTRHAIRTAITYRR